MGLRKIKKIAVTGANGFIGRYLCEYLLCHGHDVRAIVRRDGYQFPAQIDVKNSDSSKWFEDDIFEGCDVVIHLIGRAHVLNETALNPLDEFRKTNVDNVCHLVASASKAGIARIVFVSSIGVNGNRSKGESYTETDAEQPHNAYALTKLQGEQQLRMLSRQYGIEYVIVRPVLVFGPEAPGNFATLLKLAASNIPLPLKYFRAQRSIVSVWNLIDFLERCATHDAASNELFLIADEENVTLPAILAQLRIGMGKRPMIWPIPLFFVKTVMFLLGKIDSFYKLESDLIVSIIKAKTALNWQQPISTSDALRKTGAAYFKKTS